MVRLVPGYVDPPETGPGFRKDQQRPVDPYSLWLMQARGLLSPSDGESSRVYAA